MSSTKFIHCSNLGCSTITVYHQCGDSVIAVHVDDVHRSFVTCEEVCRDFLAKYDLNIEFSNRGSKSGITLVRKFPGIFRLQRKLLHPIPDAYDEMRLRLDALDDGW